MFGDRLSSSRAKLLSTPNSALEEFTSGLISGAFTKPYEALKQLAEPAQGKNPKADEQEKTPSAGKMTGEIIGSLVPYAFLNLACKRGSGLILKDAAKTNTVAVHAAEQAASGFILGAVLSPSKLSETQSLYDARISQGFCTASTFTAMSLSSRFLSKTLASADLSKGLGLARKCSIASLSGAAGGFVDIECKTGFTANKDELTASMLGYATFAAIMEGTGHAAGKLFKASTENKVQSLAESGKDSLASGSRLQEMKQKSAGQESRSEKVQGSKSDVLKAEDSMKELEDLSKELTVPSKHELLESRESMLSELKRIKGHHPLDQRKLGIYPALKHMNWMSDAEKLRFIDTMACVYKHTGEQASHNLARAEKTWRDAVAGISERIRQNRESKAPMKGEAFENELLLALFSNFRLNTGSQWWRSHTKCMEIERQLAAEKIMNKIGYPQERVKEISKLLKDEPLRAADHSGMRFPEYLRLNAGPSSKQIFESSFPEKPRTAAKLSLPEPDSLAKTEKTGKLQRWKVGNNQGEIERLEDGSCLITCKDGSASFRWDKSNKLSEAKYVDKRQFSYDANGELSQIESRLFGKIFKIKDSWYSTKKTTLTAEKSTNTDAGEAYLFHKGTIELEANGNMLCYSRSKERCRAYQIDGSVKEVSKTKRATFLSADFMHEEEKLMLSLSKAFPEKRRADRFIDLMSEFEFQAQSRGLSEQQMAIFYKELRRLINNKEKIVSEPASLAEQILLHAGDLESISQGYNNTCNVTTCENRLYSRNPEEIARMVAEIAEKGKYITNSGKIVNYFENPHAIFPDKEARTNLELQRKQLHFSSDLKYDGTRDYASQIVQNTLANIAQAQRSWLIAGNERIYSSDLAYDKNCRLLGMVEKEALEPVFDEKGKALTKLKDGQKAHRRDGLFLQELDESELVYDAYGEISGSLSSKNQIKPFYDYFGNRQDLIKEGYALFDINGNQILQRAPIGQIQYRKPKNAAGMQLERLYAKVYGESLPLKSDSKFIDSPWLDQHDYLNICHEVNGIEDRPISIARGASYGKGRAAVTVSSIDEFEDTLLNFQQENNMPAILVVHTKNKPFSKDPGGWHVINVHSYEAGKRRLEITNQWLRQQNFMMKPMTLQEAFEAMSG